jgi:phosphatidylglycerol:prolipoprotein diacylglycerol transferase
MLSYPVIDPVAIALGPLKIHWYGLMYMFGFAGAWWLSLRKARRGGFIKPNAVEDLIFYGAMGVVLGGRFGYVIFYNFERFLQEPLWLFRIWEGGMSFHGGLLGVLLALALYARKLKLDPFIVYDFIAPVVPLGLGLGRIGNFIGQELWGRPTDSSWGMVFPADPAQLARHPSQLYQALLEGLCLFIILQLYSRKPRPAPAVGGLFLAGYAVFRFSVEFVREPDSHIGFDAFGWMTRGQVLCVPMFIAGIALMLWAHKRQPQK